MDALGDARFTRRFKVVVDALTQGDNLDLKVNIMTFVNAMINAEYFLDGRVAVRQEFLDLGLLDVIAVCALWVR